jgi:hypothetical protein
MITKVLVSAAIVLGAAVGVAAPAMADPTTDPTNPVGGIGPLADGLELSCADNTDCPHVAVVNIPTVSPEQVTLTFRNGFSDPSGFYDLQTIQGQQ